VTRARAHLASLATPVRLACLAALAAPACLASPSYDGTSYRCVEDPICPPGFTCTMGVCRADPSEQLVRIEAGTFTMGCDTGTSCPTDARPAHPVTLGAFVIQRREVTQSDFAACVAAGRCDRPVDGYDPAATPDLPARGVTFAAASAYCDFIGLSLPTEAQWERAARGTDDAPYPWGADPADCAHAVFSGCGGAPSAVGSHPAGATDTGLQDLAGNVAEWVRDFDGSYPTGPVTEPQGPTSGGARIVRGGSYATAAAPVWARDREDPLHTSPSEIGDLGVRCARSSP
jgi:formylglycine-generating enzyme required for sulfatase activity